MNLALITMKQVIVLFILIFSGFIAVKFHLFKLEYKNAFSDLLMKLVVPCLIIDSYMMEFDPKILSDLIKTLIYSFSFLLLSCLIAFIICRKIKIRDKNIIFFASAFSNCAYMGFPLIEAMYGREGLIYASAFVTSFNILLWSLGYSVLSGNKDPKKQLKTIITQPAIISVFLGLIIYLAKLPIPDIISKPIGNIATLNTPLSMIITGMIIADTDIKKLFKNIYLFLIIVSRSLIIPAITFLVLILTKGHGVYAQIVFILAACPTAAISSVFAVEFKYDEDLAAVAVVITTFLSIILLPFWAFLLTLKV